MKREFQYFSRFLIAVIFLFTAVSTVSAQSQKDGLTIGEGSYFEMPGLNVLVYNNTFPEGHQGGVEIIQHGIRVATNGELRLSPTPGQWQPIPKLGIGYTARGVSPQGVELTSRAVDTVNNVISLPCSYPDSSRMRQGFNPIIYPDLQLAYEVKVKAEGHLFTITVDLEKPLPEEWVGKVGYNLEFFPGDLYGKTFFMDDSAGVFPRQPDGPTYMSSDNEAEHMPLAKGNKLVIAPESDMQRITLESPDVEMQLVDGALKHNNGWFTVRSLIPAGATKGAITWTITPNVIAGWVDQPIIHVSQVGYHPEQPKIAFIELDKNDKSSNDVLLLQLQSDGEFKVVKEGTPTKWGRYLRYNYKEFDFSDIKEQGMYKVKYGNIESNLFAVNKDVYKRHVWQPTLEYFLPVQMCHMRINDKYRVWHGACHLDDALMAPFNVSHFDGYNNEDVKTALSKYKPLEHVPGLNIGGWHDAGDYDIRVESQAQTVMALAYAYEEFGIDYDETYIDQENRHVEIHQPDGKPDILQQVEHGVLSILSGYRQFGMLYRGIICPTLRQYVHLGDASTHTDNKVCDDKELLEKAAQIDELWFTKVANRYSNVFDPSMFQDQIELVVPELDDRLVFLETNPRRQLIGAASLAAVSRVLKGYNDDLAKECIETAVALWEANKKGFEDEESFWFSSFEGQKIQTLIELILSTDKQQYKDELCGMSSSISKSFMMVGWELGGVLEHIDCQDFKDSVNAAAAAAEPKLKAMVEESPYGSTLGHAEYNAYYQYFLNKYWPDLYPEEYLFSTINYLLGCRPGNIMSSLVSGVGVNSPTIAYGANRADWSYIPGGTFWSAVNLVSPDYAEDKIWPFIWQEREYIITAPCYYMFSVLGADKILNGK